MFYESVSPTCKLLLSVYFVRVLGDSVSVWWLSLDCHKGNNMPFFLRKKKKKSYTFTFILVKLPLLSNLCLVSCKFAWQIEKAERWALSTTFLSLSSSFTIAISLPVFGFAFYPDELGSCHIEKVTSLRIVNLTDCYHGNGISLRLHCTPRRLAQRVECGMPPMCVHYHHASLKLSVLYRCFYQSTYFTYWCATGNHNKISKKFDCNCWNIQRNPVRPPSWLEVWDHTWENEKSIFSLHFVTTL